MLGRYGLIVHEQALPLHFRSCCLLPVHSAASFANSAKLHTASMCHNQFAGHIVYLLLPAMQESFRERILTVRNTELAVLWRSFVVASIKFLPVERHPRFGLCCYICCVHHTGQRPDGCQGLHFSVPLHSSAHAAVPATPAHQSSWSTHV